MPPPQSTAPARPPVLVICLVVFAVVASFSVVAAIILTILDANSTPDLPDPLVNNVGDFAACTSTITVILLGIHLLRTTSAANTRAGVAAIADARRDILNDTGEIHGLAEQIRQPEIIVVREAVHHVEQVDREAARRVLHEAKSRQQQQEAKTLTSAERALYYEAYTDAVKDLSGLNNSEEGPIEPAL